MIPLAGCVVVRGPGRRHPWGAGPSGQRPRPWSHDLLPPAMSGIEAREGVFEKGALAGSGRQQPPPTPYPTPKPCPAAVAGEWKGDHEHVWTGWGDPFNTFWCCYGSGVESFAKLADSIYFHRYVATWHACAQGLECLPSRQCVVWGLQRPAGQGWIGAGGGHARDPRRDQAIIPSRRGSTLVLPGPPTTATGCRAAWTTALFLICT